jgi:hypothetical protein
VSQKTWDTHVIVKMVSDKYVSVIQTHASQKTWDTHVIVKMESDISVYLVEVMRYTMLSAKF